MNDSDTDTLQIDRDKLGELAVENAIKINLDQSQNLSFTIARVKDPLNFFWLGGGGGTQKFRKGAPEKN